jgi:hypothetical protein
LPARHEIFSDGPPLLPQKKVLQVSVACPGTSSVQLSKPDTVPPSSGITPEDDDDAPLLDVELDEPETEHPLGVPELESTARVTSDAATLLLRQSQVRVQGQFEGIGTH